MSAKASRRPHAIAASCVFDGAVAHRNAAVIIIDDRIESVVQHAELSGNLLVYELPPGAWLAPGFIDLQVNGGGDVLFNDAPTPETIRQIVAAHRRFGTTALLPTLISDSPAKMNAAVAAVDELSGATPAFSASTSKVRSSPRKRLACTRHATLGIRPQMISI